MVEVRASLRSYLPKRDKPDEDGPNGVHGMGRGTSDYSSGGTTGTIR